MISHYKPIPLEDYLEIFGKYDKNFLILKMVYLERFGKR
jgi:hypothetical protein